MPEKLENHFKARAGRSSRPPVVRMVAIHNRLSEGKNPNCFKLAKEFEVATKTIHRDIEFMRDQLGLPIAYDRAAHGYYYSEPVSSFPTVQVSHGELVALLVAQKAVEQYRGTPFEKPLATAFSKLAGSLQEETGIGLHDLTEAISFRPQGIPVRELVGFQTLAEAVTHGREVRFIYRSLKKGTGETRTAQPYHLGCVANQWYLIAHDIDRDAVRTFALTRLEDVQETGASFTRPGDFSVTEMFSGSFSAFESGKVEKVVLHLDAFAARLTSERTWHPSQSLKEKKNGEAELTMEVSVAPDLENWILSLGEHAEVLKPTALRERIAASAKAMARKYKK